MDEFLKAGRLVLVYGKEAKYPLRTLVLVPPVLSETLLTEVCEGCVVVVSSSS